MQEENSLITMEKKPLPRQQASLERKTDYSAKNNGRKKWKDNNSLGGRSVDPTTAATKPVPKWSRGNSDKRPRQRCYNGNRQREEVGETDHALEVFSTNSRKGNANDLLRFHYGNPRGESGRSHGRWSHSGCNSGYHRPRKTVRYNKEQFLQASCQFVVEDGGEYSAQAIDPDTLVKWEMIELVRTFSTESVTCPICLCVPFAGKITKCGHIFCWACMMRYLTLGEKNYRKCPICYDTVNLEDLKSVQWIEVPDYQIGDRIEMKLMRKSKGSVYVCPKFQWQERNGIPHNFQDGNNTKFSKILVADKNQIQREVIEAEEAALTVQLEAAEELEKPFIVMAQDLLKIRKDLLQAISEPSSKAISESSPQVTECDHQPLELEGVAMANETMEHDTLTLNNTDLENEMKELSNSTTSAINMETSSRQRMDSESSLPFGSPVNPFVLDKQPVSQSRCVEEVHDNLELPIDSLTKKKKVHAKDTFYFYQAATGQHIYMHSLNARCLQQENGSLEYCPETISAKIVAIKRMFMTEDLRKRLRYLSHVPLTCEFHVVELELKPLLSKETYMMFRGEIENLKKERRKEKKEDKLRAKQAELEHRKAHGLYPDMNFQLDSNLQFPLQLASTLDSSVTENVEDTSVEQSQLLASSPSDTRLDSGTSSPDSFSFAAATAWGTDSSSQASPWDNKSFAKIAGCGSVVGAPTVQRWRCMPESQSMPLVSRPVVVGSDGEEELHAPSYGEAMAAAFSCLDIGQLASPIEKDDATPAKAVTGKKKKKKEKQLLFSTSMARKP